MFSLNKQLGKTFDDACQIIGQVPIQKSTLSEETCRLLLAEEINRLTHHYKELTGEEHLAMAIRSPGIQPV
ncbi:hypothetical protein ACTUSQ_23815 [Pantoea ananatis]|uniref:hypothetical protein n=1 Tax=Pantoea ananas TaxID=553 RepID=UPI003FA476F9